MIDTVIVSGGNIQKDFALGFLKKIIDQTERNNITVIAADKGLEFFIDTDWNPDYVVGDFDSVSDIGKQYLEQDHGFQVQRLKPEKDDSDTQSAVNMAISMGAENILIIGGFGTRLDHVMANIELLLMAKKQNVKLSLVDYHNFIILADNEMKIKREEQFGKYISFFPLSGNVEGLTLKGFKYKLENYDLKAEDCGLTVSNEMQEDIATVSFKTGNLMMIMSRD